MDARIRIFLRIIEEWGGTPAMTSSEIARLLGLGKARLLRLFSKEVGKTLRRHLLEVRMARAAELVKNTAIPVKTISFQCGYTALSNFYRDFKRVHGISPIRMRFRYLRAQFPEIPAPIKRQLKHLEIANRIESVESLPNRHKKTA